MKSNAINAFREYAANEKSNPLKVEKKNKKEACRSKKNITFAPGEMAERSNAAVLKTVDCNRSGGSNPSFSAFARRSELRRTQSEGIA